MGRDRSAGTLDQVTGGINGGIGGGGGRKGGGGRAGGGGLLPNVGGSLGVSKTGQQVDNLRYGTDQTRSSDSSSSSSSGVRDEHSNGSGASTSDGTYVRSGSFSRSSVTSSSSVSTEDALSRARSYSEAARRMEELSQSLARDASFAESHGMQLSENMSQDLAQWYRLQQALHPNLDAPELWATDLTPQKRAVRDQLIQQWAQEKRDALWSEISGDIKDPSLVDVSRIDLDAGDVRGSYNPRGVSGIGSGGGGGDPGAAARMIADGQAKLDGDRAAAEAARNNRGGANVDLQSEVGRELNRGFFTDPNLRK